MVTALFRYFIFSDDFFHAEKKKTFCTIFWNRKFCSPFPSQWKRFFYLQIIINFTVISNCDYKCVRNADGNDGLIDLWSCCLPKFDFRVAAKTKDWLFFFVGSARTHLWIQYFPFQTIFHVAIVGVGRFQAQTCPFDASQCWTIQYRWRSTWRSWIRFGCYQHICAVDAHNFQCPFPETVFPPLLSFECFSTQLGLGANEQKCQWCRNEKHKF